MTLPTTKPLRVGISACLLGEQVRHDGGHKRSRYCTDTLSHYFQFQPVCPEVQAGFGAPRPTMHLVASSDGNRLRTTPRVSHGQPQDMTAAMHGFIEQYLPNIAGLRGFILMQKSPSCGLKRVRIHDAQGEVKRRDGAGLFAAALQQHYPLLPLEEAGRLHDDRLCENFIERVYFFDDWCRLQETGLTAKSLLHFHRRHKFQLLAHDQMRYRQLGPALANLKAAPLEDIASDYIHLAMAAMRQVASSGSYTNVMQHLAGYVREHLDPHSYRMIGEQIAGYQAGEVPLIVPMTLIRNAQAKVEQPYLAHQDFLAPYPDQLGLRNRL